MAQIERRRRDDDQHEAILEKLNAIELKLAATEHFYKQLTDVYTAVKGNGKPGLEQRMAVQEERETKRDRREWLVTSVIVAQIIGIALLAVMEFAGK